MPVIGKMDGIVFRVLYSKVFGTRLHAICGDIEIVLSVWPLRVIQGEAPAGIQRKVMAWATAHYEQLMAACRRCEMGLAPMPVR